MQVLKNLITYPIAVLQSPLNASADLIGFSRYGTLINITQVLVCSAEKGYSLSHWQFEFFHLG